MISGHLRGPSTASADEAGGVSHFSPPALLALTAAAALLGVGVGWSALRLSPAIHFRPTPAHGAVLLGALVAAVAILRRPVLGLVALVLMVYLDLSDILIRFHGLPSLLQLLAIPLLLAALVRWRGRVLEGASPAALTVALLAYVAVFVASLAVAAEPALAQGRAVAAAKGFAICVLVALLADTPEKVRIGAWTLAGGGLLLAGIALAHAAVGAHGSDFGGFARVEYVPVYEDVMEVRAAGPLGDANFFAQILVAVVPIALLLAWKERNRWLQILALAAATVISVATLFTYSRGGALALAVVVVCSLFAAHPSRRRLAVGGLLIVAALVLVPRNVTRRLSTLGQLLPGRERVSEIDTSFQSRLLQARVAWEIFIDHPLLGVGAGNYTAHYYEYADEVGSAAPEYDNAGGDHYPHDLYLELASETGFLGLAAFGAVLVLVFGYLRRAERSFFAEDQELHAALASALQIAVLGYLVSSLFLHGHFQRYLWILLGLSLALAREAPGEPRTAAFSVDGVSPGDAAGSLAGGRTAEPRATRAALAAGAASFAREGKEMT